MLVLFETSAGFALFKVLQEGRLQQVDDLAADFETPEKAKKLVTLKKFSPFNNTADALKSATALIESKLSKTLKKFLKKEIVDKKLNEKLAVSDPKLGGAILDKLGIQCTHDKAVAELFRGIRSQIENLVAELSGSDYNAMSLGLSHSLSRYKLKFSPDKVDTMIVQAIALLDDLDKELNTYSMRVREWYGWHFPELSKVIPDNLLYTKTVKRMGSRTNAATTDFSDFLPEELIPELRDAAMISMGTEVSEEDIQNITELCDQVISIAQYREQLYEYLKNRMQAIAPNLTILVGELVGARLIAHAGSLLSLAKHPASTVQILGAEKALFRALKTKHATPKYGLIYHASLIGQAPPKYKGKIARLVGAKAALACRYDALGEGETNTEIGSDGRAKIEQRIRSLDSGQTHRISGTGKGKQTKKYDQKEALNNVTSGHYKASNDAVTPDKSAKKRKNQDENQNQEEETQEAEPKVEKREKKKKKTQQQQ